MNRLTARVAARGFAHQIAALGRANAAADAVEQVIHRSWLDLLSLLQSHRPGQSLAMYYAVQRLLTPMLPLAAQTVATAVAATARHSFDSAAETLLERLPVPALAAAAGDEKLAESRLIEKGVEFGFGSIKSPLDGIRRISKAKTKELFRELIFPTPDQATVDRITFAGDWLQRFAAQSRLASPQAIATVIQNAFAGGKTTKQVADDLLPVLNNVRSSARRVARNESMRVAHAMQQEAWSGLGDMVMGSQVHAVLDDRTRPEHRARNGQLFYKRPKEGQRGMDECPQPPYESPKDGGKIAHNCRCFLTPVLADPSDMRKELLPAAPLDREVMADWFDTSSHRDQRIAVGAERYDLVTSALGRKPTWFDFTADSGQMLPVDSLRSILGGKA